MTTKQKPLFHKDLGLLGRKFGERRNPQVTYYQKIRPIGNRDLENLSPARVSTPTKHRVTLVFKNAEVRTDSLRASFLTAMIAENRRLDCVNLR